MATRAASSPTWRASWCSIRKCSSTCREAEGGVGSVPAIADTMDRIEKQLAGHGGARAYSGTEPLLRV